MFYLSRYDKLPLIDLTQHFLSVFLAIPSINSISLAFKLILLFIVLLCISIRQSLWSFSSKHDDGLSMSAMSLLLCNHVLSSNYFLSDSFTTMTFFWACISINLRSLSVVNELSELQIILRLLIKRLISSSFASQLLAFK